MKHLKTFNESHEHAGQDNQYLDLIEDCLFTISDRFTEYKGKNEIGILKALYKLKGEGTGGYTGDDSIGQVISNARMLDTINKYYDGSIENGLDNDLRIAYIVRFDLGSNAQNGRLVSQVCPRNRLSTNGRITDYDVEELSRNFLILSEELPEIKDRLSEITEDMAFTCQSFNRFEILIILNKEASKEVGW